MYGNKKSKILNAYVWLFSVRKKLLSLTVWESKNKCKSSNLLCFLVKEKYKLYDKKKQNTLTLINAFISAFILTIVSQKSAAKYKSQPQFVSVRKRNSLLQTVDRKVLKI